MEDRIGQGSHVQDGGSHLLAAQPGEVQQFINQSAHAVRFAVDDSCDTFAFRADFVPVILHQNLRITGNATERGAQIVRHRIRKGFQFPVRRLQLRSSFRNATLKSGIQSLNLFIRPFAVGNVGAIDAQAPRGWHVTYGLGVATFTHIEVSAHRFSTAVQQRLGRIFHTGEPGMSQAQDLQVRKHPGGEGIRILDCARRQIQFDNGIWIILRKRSQPGHLFFGALSFDDFGFKVVGRLHEFRRAFLDPQLKFFCRLTPQPR